MKDTLLTAKHTIERLRHQNEILGAKVEVMELFACVLHTRPAESCRGSEVDIVWEIDRELKRLEMLEKKGPCPEGMNHFCPGSSGLGEWSHRSTEVPSNCAYCGEPNYVSVAAAGS